ncbi:AI-2E family transporter [Novosphingobium sp.]|uniref:AI-2E family transporter n=1 Tax=Novosphingobium sp. TaxID=1874826 RepID=UPI003D0C7B57
MSETNAPPPTQPPASPPQFNEPIRQPGTYKRNHADPWTAGQRRAGLVALALFALLGLWTLRVFLPAIGWALILAISLWPWRNRAVAFWPKGADFTWPALFTLTVALFFVMPLLMVAHAVALDGHFALQWAMDVRAHGLPAPDILAHLPAGPAATAWWQAHLATPQAFGNLHIPGGTGRSPFGEGQHILGLVLHRVVLAVFLLLILFFLLRDGDRVGDSLHNGCERLFGRAGVNVALQALRAVRGTVNGLVVVGFGEAVLLGLVYFFSGAPHAALLGLLTGLLSVIPLGSVIAAAVAAIALAAAGKITAAIIVAVIASIVIFVADHFVRPVMIGDATRLPFLVVLLGILGGIEAWGLIGLVVGPALMAVLMLLWREWVGSQKGPLNPPPA